MTRHVVLALVTSMLGVGVFRALGLPLPWLLGPMFGCLIAALAGFELKGPPLVGDAMRTVLGVAVGASITPDVVGRLDEMAASIALVPPFILLIGLVGYPYFRRVWGFDSATSYYGAMPGGLQDMLIFGEEAGGNLRHLSLIHATRVLIIVTGLPVVLSLALGLDLDHAFGAPASNLPISELLMMVGIAIVGWWGASKVGLFGATILGPMILAAIASMTGLIHSRPPTEAILAAQFFIGLSVGAQYAGITWSELTRVVTAAIGYTLIIGVLAFGVAALAILLGLAPTVEALLAFSPGGQAEMAILAIVSGADIAFVVTHHLVRIVVVIIGAPIVRRWLD